MVIRAAHLTWHAFLGFIWAHQKVVFGLFLPYLHSINFGITLKFRAYLMIWPHSIIYFWYGNIGYQNYFKNSKVWKSKIFYAAFMYITIQKNFLIWISRSFKKGASYNNISYFDQSFRLSGLWLILSRDLGRSGQNKLWGTENRERTNNFFLNFEQCAKSSV